MAVKRGFGEESWSEACEPQAKTLVLASRLPCSQPALAEQRVCAVDEDSGAWKWRRGEPQERTFLLQLSLA